MTVSRFSDALGCVDEKYVTEAVAYTAGKSVVTPAKKAGKVWRRAALAAACLVLVVLGGVIVRSVRPSASPQSPVGSYFVLTVHAENGDTAVLLPNEKFFNSSTEHENMFGGEHPLFSFTVQPSAPEGNRAIYSAYDVSVLYDGVPVGGRDEHISLGYEVPIRSDGPWSYWILGWCAESAEITITVTDKESEETVEYFVVHVAYFADRQEYELEIVECESTCPAESAGITVTAIEKESGETVDHFAVRVAYFAERQEYESETVECESTCPAGTAG